VERIDKQCVCESCEFKDIVFRHLDDADILELCNNKHENYYRKGDIIIYQGHRITDFKYLKRGLVKVYRHFSDEDEQIIAITKPFEFVNNIALIDGVFYNYSVSALEDTEICSVNMDFIRELLKRNGSFAIGLLTKMASMNNKIISQFLDIRRRNLTGKVAYVLLYFAREINHSMIFDLPVSRKEIADYIGMSTANVIRTLSEFKNDKIIKVYGKTIEIVDAGKLEMFSKKG